MLFSWLAVGLVGCLVGWLKSWSTDILVSSPLKQLWNRVIKLLSC